MAPTESKRSTLTAIVENVAVLAPDPIADTLRLALKDWSYGRDARGLRRALLAVLAKLDDAP